MKVYEEVIDIVANTPIIAAVTSVEDVKEAIASPCDVLFLLSGTIQSMKEIIDLIHDADKIVFVHLDLMKGLAYDREGLAYLKEVFKPDGVISTKGMVVKKAKDIGFATIQRLFVLDSKSIGMGIKQLRDMKPDFVEVMPGGMPKIIKRISEQVTTPVIAGGLIDQADEIMPLLKAGAISVSTSARPLWEL